MIPNGEHTIFLNITRTKEFVHFRIVGHGNVPFRFELIDLDGKRLKSFIVVYGNEFFISSEGLKNEEYLFTISTDEALIHTGVLKP